MPTSSPYRLRRALVAGLCSVFFLFAALSGPLAAQDAERQVWNLPAAGLMEQVNLIAQQAGLQVIYGNGTDAPRARENAPLAGSYSWREALDRTLAGTRLAWELVGEDTVVIKLGAPSAPPPAAAPARAAEPATDAEEAAAEEIAELRGMTVTGTHIRGASTPSPVIEITAVEIEQQGFTDLGQVIRSMPQNFRGGENPGVVRVSQSFGRAENGNQTGGSALNLRGLGPGATLTLLNGRRMSYGGDSQAVDIAQIPIEAVERMEVMADGASAIYGSDAVAGVGNVILKRNYDGVALGTDQGFATHGGLRKQIYTLTAGKAWSTGSALLAFTDESHGAIYADQRDYTEYMNDPYTIFPKVKGHGLLLSANQAFGDRVDAEIDILSSRRRQWLKSSYVTDYMTYMPVNTNQLIAPALNVALTDDWTLSLSGSWGRNRNSEELTDTYLDTAEVEHFGTYKLNNSIRSWQADVEGPLFAIGENDVRLAAGVGYRANKFENINVLYPENNYGGEEKSKSVYAELNVPFVGPEAGVAGVRNLAFTAAVRSEDYDSFGRVTTPKLGLIYSPNADFTLKGTWGKSFKAPTLTERFGGQYGYIGWAVDDGYPGEDGEGLVDLYVVGGNPDLRPERARVWSTTASFHPEAVRGFRLDLTAYDIDYTSRIVEPIQNSVFALSNPAYADFVMLKPSQEQYDAIVSQLWVLDNWMDIEYQPDGLHAIILDYLTNAERQRIRGLDLSASLSRDLGIGELRINGTLSRLLSRQRTLPGQPSQPLSGTIYNPPKLSGRLGATWTAGAFSVAAYMNHTGSVLENYWDEDGRSTLPAFNVLDATLRYVPDAGLLSGFEFSLSVDNVLDRKPTLFEVPGWYVLPYDATNASPIGRYVSLGVLRRW